MGQFSYVAWIINSSDKTGPGGDATIFTDGIDHVLTASSTFSVFSETIGIVNGTYTYEGVATVSYPDIPDTTAHGFYAKDPDGNDVFLTREASGFGQTAVESPGGSFDLTTGSTVPCFVAGSRLAVPDGEIAIEDLRVGDSLLTANGEAKPIVWIGRSQVDCRRHSNPNLVLPVRLRAGAFSPGMPKRDLLLSPGHAVFTENVLIPVCHLINDISILREEGAKTVTYYHVELAAHDVVVAEGLPTESYLDDDNRGAFDNGGAHRVLHPDHGPKNWGSACAPKCESGEKLTAAKRRIRARLEACGYRLERNFEVELFAAGRRLVPQFTCGGLFHFLLPAGVTDVRLVSPRGVPATVFDESNDTRWLGAQMAAVLLEGEWIPIDSPMLAEGFYAPEHDASGSWRWSNGNAKLCLPPSDASRLLVLFVRDVMRYWVAPAQTAFFAAAA